MKSYSNASSGTMEVKWARAGGTFVFEADLLISDRALAQLKAS